MTMLLDRWDLTVTTQGRDLVLPDGCRDLILVDTPGSAPTAFVSDLHARPIWSTGFCPGTRLRGYRLVPGVRIQADRLIAQVKAADGDPAAPLQSIEEHCRRNAGIAEAFSAIETTAATTAAGLARYLSVTSRTLQRQFSANDLPPPGFWLRLARARRGALELRHDRPLADIAAEAGYADQAHMTRAFQHWFAATPAELRTDPARLSLLAQSGLAIPATGEQISTKYPSGSDT